MAGSRAYFAMTFEKGSPLAQCVNLAPQEMKDDGMLDEICQEWLTDEADAQVIEGRARPDESGSLGDEFPRRWGFAVDPAFGDAFDGYRDPQWLRAATEVRNADRCFPRAAFLYIDDLCIVNQALDLESCIGRLDPAHLSDDGCWCIPRDVEILLAVEIAHVDTGDAGTFWRRQHGPGHVG